MQRNKNSPGICAVDLKRKAKLWHVIMRTVGSSKVLFPETNLKPKHHYLCHYPALILKFGPLIRLWTMRFESKHSYFKICARNLKNFKNLCLTLSLTDIRCCRLIFQQAQRVRLFSKLKIFLHFTFKM